MGNENFVYNAKTTKLASCEMKRTFCLMGNIFFYSKLNLSLYAKTCKKEEKKYVGYKMLNSCKTGLVTLDI